MREKLWYRVFLDKAILRSDYIVRADGFDEAAEKAVKADNAKNEGKYSSVFRIEVYGEENSVLK